MSPKRKYEEEVESWQEAVVLILSGFGYLWKNKKIPTLAVLGMFFGQNVTAWVKVISDPIATFQKAEPVQVARPEGFRFDLVPRAYAGYEPNAIIIKGRMYGIADTNYVFWKIRGKNAAIVYHKRADEVAKIGTPSIEFEDFLYIKGSK